MAPDDNLKAAREAVAANPVWYHTIELAPGVMTPGFVDMRPAAPRILPSALDGKRALDAGTFDGFWAFELENRGAEVIAIDLERIDDAQWPPHKREQLRLQTKEAGVELGRGFALASDALGSRVERVICDIYDVTPERIGGQVDLAFIGALLLHLRDPVRALEAIRGCLSPGGELRLLEPFSIALSLRARRRPAASFETFSTPFNWWVANLAGLDAWLLTAGFERTERLAFVRPPARREIRQSYVALKATPPR